MKLLLEEIAALEPASAIWRAKMTVVIENVEHHAKEDETDMFPAIRGAADAAALGDRATQLEARKTSLGAPVFADKIDLTTNALRKLATDQRIPGRSSMRHDELAATVALG